MILGFFVTIILVGIWCVIYTVLHGTALNLGTYAAPIVPWITQTILTWFDDGMLRPTVILGGVLVIAWMPFLFRMRHLGTSKTHVAGFGDVLIIKPKGEPDDKEGA